MANTFSTDINVTSNNQKFVRMSITVPITIKQRMIDYVLDPNGDYEVNWSKIASRAFKEFLKQNERKRKKKTRRRAG